MATLAMPVVVAEIGWVAMGLVDTLMVGPLGPEAIGAVGIGSAVFMGVVIFAMGLFLGLDTLVSHAYGAGRVDDCHRWLVHGTLLSLVVSVPITLLLLALSTLLGSWGLDPAVYRLSRPYLGILVWSAAPLLLYATFRRYLQGGRRAAGDDCSRGGQRHQRDRQLGSDLWEARRPGIGRTRLSVGDRHVARGHGGVSAGCHRRARTRAAPRTVRNVAGD